MSAYSSWKEKVAGCLEELSDGEVADLNDLDEQPLEESILAMYGNGMLPREAARQILSDAGYLVNEEGGPDPAEGDPGDENDGLAELDTEDSSEEDEVQGWELDPEDLD